MVVLKVSRPQIKKMEVTAPIPVVRTIKVKVGSQPVFIRSEGTVRPLQEINLVPQIDGKVVYVAPFLVNGGEFSKGEVLLRIESVDYQLAVTLAIAGVKNSESNLKLLKEESGAAREEWFLHSDDASQIHKKPPPLVVKEPQLAAAQAKLEADRANLKKALLNLERTELFAPFDGRVSWENIDIGQYVSPGQSLATLYSTETAEIILPMESESLSWFHVPGFTLGDGPGSSANVLFRIAGKEMNLPGEVVRAEGKLDERTRMVNVVVQVKNPYKKKPPLAMGLFVTVDIKGYNLPYAAIIPRAALRQGDVVWIVDKDSRLYFRKVKVARIQGEKVLVKSGIKDGEIAVISPLKAVSDGMTVRTVPVKNGDGL